MLNEIIIALISFLYVLMCLAAGEAFFRTGLASRSDAFHIAGLAVAGWVFFPYFGINDPLVAAAVPALLFALYLFFAVTLKRLPVYLSVNPETRRPEAGPVLFSFGATLLVFIFWRWFPDYKFVAVIALLAAGWGVGAARVIDRSLGRYKYQVINKTKSVEGAATVFLVTFIASSALMPTTKIGSGMFLSTSICAAVVATAADILAPRLTETLAVALATAAVVGWWVLAV